ncbi:MAG: c-type cytochrome [Gammaproteobacteria bacterium]|nr:c-type cytochrome [Gammaproteobacteria bacterium]MCW8910503.1 c-type cytochrome [Gammaproteobacteria bacterium]MCW9004639.1 c-type cytochrome [Gammaproteobacteria bacterium]MCW9055659.1 c-type cytochrome [Gammaproteobacteria bacterium]
MKQPSHYIIITIALFSTLFSSNTSAEFSKSFEGYQVFDTYCFICHGKDGKGNGPLASKIGTPPTDLTDDKILSKRTDKELKRIVEGSLPHGNATDSKSTTTNMPRWGVAISHVQIRSLVSYIRYMHRSKHSLPGNPVSGKKVYDNYCIQCHGAYGEGDGVLTRVYPMEPADHTNHKDMDKISNNQLRSIISKGGTGASLMPGWKNILTDKEINDSISYIRLIAAH